MDLYSAFIEVPYTQGAQVRITQCYLRTYLVRCSESNICTLQHHASRLLHQSKDFSSGIKSDWDCASQQTVRRMLWATVAAKSKSKHRDIPLPAVGPQHWLLIGYQMWCFETQSCSDFDLYDLTLAYFDLICKSILTYDFDLNQNFRDRFRDHSQHCPYHQQARCNRRFS